MIKSLSLMILGAAMGAGIYDLAIHLKISYNEDSLKIYCKKGRLFEQIQKGTDVFVKTKLECFNETEEGKQNDNRNRKQNPH